MPKIHPTAIVHPSAALADDVEIGPYCIVEEDVQIGPGCVLRPSVIIRRYTTLGRNNYVDSFTAIGGEPQDLKFDQKTKSYVKIGDNNVFREGVTISRATGDGLCTTVGNGTYWMTGAHAGHNATIEDEVILVNRAAVGGHATIGKRAILSAHVGVHQFCWVGEMVMSQGNGGAASHVPPYTVFANVNNLIGLNKIGLRRAKHLTDKDRAEIKEAFRLTYRAKLSHSEALKEMDAHAEWGAGARVFRDFLRRVVEAKPPFNRGLCPLRSRREFFTQESRE